MKLFSVLLQYPDAEAVEPGGAVETYYAWVKAEDTQGAVAAARAEAEEHNDSLFRGEDFPVLLVTEGHNYGLNFDFPNM